jgi:hypothetical protein
MIRGEVIRFVSHPPAGRTWSESSWYVPHMRDVLAEGHSTAIDVGHLIFYGISLEDLLT